MIMTTGNIVQQYNKNIVLMPIIKFLSGTTEYGFQFDTEHSLKRFLYLLEKYTDIRWRSCCLPTEYTNYGVVVGLYNLRDDYTPVLSYSIYTSDREKTLHSLDICEVNNVLIVDNYYLDIVERMLSK